MSWGVAGRKTHVFIIDPNKYKTVAEVRMPRAPEHIVVSNSSPDIQLPSIPRHDVWNFLIGKSLWNDAMYNEALPWTKGGIIISLVTVVAKYEVNWQIGWKNVGSDLVSNVFGWSKAGIYQNWVNLESQIFILIGSFSNFNSHIGAHLLVHYTLHERGIIFGGRSYLFHRGGRSRRLKNGLLHSRGLRFAGVLGVTRKLQSNPPKSASEYGKKKRDYGESHGRTGHPPIGYRNMGFFFFTVIGLRACLCGCANIYDRARGGLKCQGRRFWLAIARCAICFSSLALILSVASAST